MIASAFGSGSSPSSEASYKDTGTDCQLTCYLCMEFQEPGEGVVGGEALYAIVRDPMFGPALRALDLPLDVVHQPLHAGVEAVGVLAWQELGGPVPVQADAAGEQLVKLLHPEAAAAELPQPLVIRVLSGCLSENIHSQSWSDLRLLFLL